MSQTSTEGSSRRVLEPIERISEVLFGVIMVLTFTGSLSVAEAGREDVRTMLIGAIGCNRDRDVVHHRLRVRPLFRISPLANGDRHGPARRFAGGTHDCSWRMNHLRIFALVSAVLLAAARAQAEDAVDEEKKWAFSIS